MLRKATDKKVEMFWQLINMGMLWQTTDKWQQCYSKLIREFTDKNREAKVLWVFFLYQQSWSYDLWHYNSNLLTFPWKNCEFARKAWGVSYFPSSSVEDARIPHASDSVVPVNNIIYWISSWKWSITIKNSPRSLEVSIAPQTSYCTQHNNKQTPHNPNS